MFLWKFILPMNVSAIHFHIEDLDTIVEQAVTRVLNEIDPALAKFQNIADQLVATIETRIRQNVFAIFYSLGTNLFILLLVIIVAFILLLIVLWLLETVMKNFDFELATRKFVALLVLMVVFVWLFVATVLSTFPLEQGIDLQTLKYGLFGLFSFASGMVVFFWTRWLCVHREYIQRLFLHELFDFQASSNRAMPLPKVEKRASYLPMVPLRTDVLSSDY